MDDLIVGVLDWANGKGILENGTNEAQALKTLEEAMELLHAVRENNPDNIEEEIGDVLVTVIIQTKMQHMDLYQCLQASLEKIRKRNGKMINGAFVRGV